MCTSLFKLAFLLRSGTYVCLVNLFEVDIELGDLFGPINHQINSLKQNSSVLAKIKPRIIEDLILIGITMTLFSYYV